MLKSNDLFSVPRQHHSKKQTSNIFWNLYFGTKNVLFFISPWITHHRNCSALYSQQLFWLIFFVLLKPANFYFLSPILFFTPPEITVLQSPPPPLLASSAQLCTRGIGELFLTDFLCAFCTGKLTFAMCTIPTTTCQSIHITSSSIIDGNQSQMKSFGEKDSWLFLRFNWQFYFALNCKLGCPRLWSFKAISKHRNDTNSYFHNLELGFHKNMGMILILYQ